MFSIIEKYYDDDFNGFYTCRIIDGKGFSRLMIITAYNDGKAIGDDTYGAINYLSYKKDVEDVFKRAYVDRIRKEEEATISKDSKYLANYLAQKVCGILEKSWYIISNDYLLRVLHKLIKMPGNLYSGQDFVCIMYNIKTVSEHFDSLRALSIGWGFSCLSSIYICSGFLKEDYYKTDLFKVIVECMDKTVYLRNCLSKISLDIAKICEIKEVQQDDELMSNLYPIYTNLECFLTEEQKVDLSFYEEKVASEEEAKKDKGIKKISVDDTLLDDGADMLDNISVLLKQNPDQLKVTQNSMEKLRISLNNCQQQLDEMDKASYSTGVKKARYQSSFEGQELPFENQEIS